MARPRATLTGHGVLVDLDLEIFIILSNFLHLPSDLFSDLLFCLQVMGDWVLYHLLRNLLFTFLHGLQRNKFLTRKLHIDILELI